MYSSSPSEFYQMGDALDKQQDWVKREELNT